MHTGEQDAGDDPAALDRAGEAQQLVPLPNDELVADPACEQRVGCESGLAGPEAVERNVGDVAEARDEPPAEEIEAREHQLRRAVSVGHVDLRGFVGEDDCVEGVQAFSFGDRDDRAGEIPMAAVTTFAFDAGPSQLRRYRRCALPRVAHPTYAP